MKGHIADDEYLSLFKEETVRFIKFRLEHYDADGTKPIKIYYNSEITNLEDYTIYINCYIKVTSYEYFNCFINCKFNTSIDYEIIKRSMLDRFLSVLHIPHSIYFNKDSSYLKHMLKLVRNDLVNVYRLLMNCNKNS